MPKPTLTVYSRTLYAHTWTLNIALLRSQVELARFKQAADKRRYNVLSICPVAHPFTLAGFGVFDAAKLQLFPDIERKSFINAVQTCWKHLILLSPPTGRQSPWVWIIGIVSPTCGLLDCRFILFPLAQSPLGTSVAWHSYSSVVPAFHCLRQKG